MKYIIGFFVALILILLLVKLSSNFSIDELEDWDTIVTYVFLIVVGSYLLLFSRLLVLGEICWNLLLYQELDSLDELKTIELKAFKPFIGLGLILLISTISLLWLILWGILNLSTIVNPNFSLYSTEAEIAIGLILRLSGSVFGIAIAIIYYNFLRFLRS